MNRINAVRVIADFAADVLQRDALDIRRLKVDAEVRDISTADYAQRLGRLAAKILSQEGIGADQCTQMVQFITALGGPTEIVKDAYMALTGQAYPTVSEALFAA